jgi:crotonobetainyl-CoA:carnitine CoA-transferase CaiB-like acyl-CoA transferase
MQDDSKRQTSRDGGGPLAHLRVLDLSRVLAGPWCTQMLADLGATIIKIERPGSGDETRGWGPPWLRDEAGMETSESAYYLAANRGKKSVTLDLRSERGQALARELAACCDVVIENFRPGKLAEYGLDYETLSALRPGLVYCSITGFGQTGPYRDRPGYDFMIQAMGGLMSVTGGPDGEPGGGPLKVGVALADILTGLYAGSGILAALAHRDRTGVGQHVDVGLLDVQVACLANQAMNYLVSGEPPGRLGNAHPNIVPYQTFATRDGHIVVAVGNDRQFGDLCGLLGLPGLAGDERYATNAARVRHRDVLIPALQAVFRDRRSRDWLESLEAAEIPCGPINRLDEVFDDPQVRSRGMRTDLPHALAGTVPQVGSPLKLSATPARVGPAPPLLGEHTAEVLCDLLGLDAAAIERLRATGVI